MVKNNFFAAIGRRKQAVARVRLVKAKEPILINNLPQDKYFPGEVYQKMLEGPLKLTDLLGKYTATVRVVGSGRASQILAVIHGLSRAIVKLDEKLKPALKSAGYLRRDPRKRQRRMIGTGGKARRRKQSPKR